jgi:hypothetical protein
MESAAAATGELKEFKSVRLYRPRAEILSGKWKFPEPQPMQ